MRSQIRQIYAALFLTHAERAAVKFIGQIF
jgi:hypothetical protein